MPLPTPTDRIEGGLVGLLVGDALGVPYEFHAPEDLPPLDAIEMEPPEGFRRSHATVPPGTWSDDGAQALCLLASLLDRGRLDLEDLGRRLLAWYEEGVPGRRRRRLRHRPDDRPRPPTAARRRPRRRWPGRAATATTATVRLMRVLPLALWHRGTDAELIDLACSQSKLTHGHAKAQACCAAYCLWARRTLEGGRRPVARRRLRACATSASMILP